jgi:hypothetical protein
MKKSDWPSISFLFRMTVRTCFLLYYNFCLWNYVKELCSAQRSDGPEWNRIPHLRVQRYNFSTNRQNNQILFLKNIPRQLTIHYILYIVRPGKLIKSASESVFPLLQARVDIGA